MKMRIAIAADIRYAGQGHELTIAIDRSAIQARDARAIRSAFTADYHRRHNLVLDHLPIEVVSWRVRAQGPAVAQQVNRGTHGEPSGHVAIERRRAFFRESGGLVEVPVQQRAQLSANDVVTGPALIEEETTTSVIGPNWSARLDQIGNIVMRTTS